MRVLHIDTGREMRGGQWQVLLLLRELKRLGVETRLMARPQSPLFQAAATEQIDTLPLGAAALAQARAFDLIHAHDARAHTLGLLLPQPLVVSRRVAFEVKRSPWSRFKYRRAAHYLAVSSAVKASLIRARVPENRITVVYDGVPAPSGMRGAERTLALALDSEDPGKGRALIEAAAQLNGLTIHFSNDLERDLPRARLFTYITDLEGLGSAALLAMAHGAPVIASRAGGLPEIVRHEETGLLTENSPQAIAKAMRRLWDDAALARHLAVNAWRMVERDFTAARMAEQTLHVYEKVLG